MKFNQLQSYIPENALFFIEKWINNYALTLKITKNRLTKLGDYRKIRENKRHQITINGDLNPDAFFFVLTHEIAHMMVYDNYAFGEVLPHGAEWKLTFGNLLKESVGIYPDHLQSFILKHAKSPKASVGADINIAKYLINDAKNNQCYLDEIELGEQFILNKKIYKKGDRIKLRYICCEIKTQKKYLINASALVEKL